MKCGFNWAKDGLNHAVSKDTLAKRTTHLLTNRFQNRRLLRNDSSFNQPVSKEMLVTRFPWFQWLFFILIWQHYYCIIFISKIILTAFSVFCFFICPEIGSQKHTWVCAHAVGFRPNVCFIKYSPVFDLHKMGINHGFSTFSILFIIFIGEQYLRAVMCEVIYVTLYGCKLQITCLCTCTQNCSHSEYVFKRHNRMKM